MKKKILFIDDEKDVLTVGKLMIQSLGHEVLLMDSGEKAIEFMSSNDASEIDLVFLDLMMPGMTGLDVLKFMKDSNIQIPTILQTGMATDGDLKQARNLGAVDHLCKPYTKKDLESLINKYARQYISVV
jgi:CheY-like chemotaxis protein